MTVTIPESARLATPPRDRTICPVCGHFHREATAKKCRCCSEMEGDAPKPTKPRKRTPPKPKPPAEKPEPFYLIPHVWVQKCEPFPDRLAGQLFTSQGRPAHYEHAVGQWHHFRLAPIWTQPRTQEGLDQLFDQLLADAKRAQRGAA